MNNLIFEKFKVSFYFFPKIKAPSIEAISFLSILGGSRFKRPNDFYYLNEMKKVFFHLFAYLIFLKNWLLLSKIRFF